MDEWNPNLPEIPAPKRKSRKKHRRLPRKRGRKKQKRAFEDTALGYNLQLHAPLEYDMITNACSGEPSADLIEAVGYASLNPYFRGVFFRMHLIDYRKNGCYQKSPAKSMNAETIKRHLLLRRKNMKL